MTPSARSFWQQDAESTISPFPSRTRVNTSRVLALVLVLICVTLGMLVSLLGLAESGDPTAMMETLRSLPEHFSSRTLLIGGGLLAATGIGLVLIFGGLAFSLVRNLLRPPKPDAFLPLTPFTFDLPAEEVTFPSFQGKHLVRGIYAARQHATTTVILCPASRRPLSDVLGMGKHLWKAGHHVLAFEYAGPEAVGGGPMIPGEREVQDFLGAVAYARQREPQARIGALGYALGGAVSILGSAPTPEVLAVAADSAFASLWSVVEMAVRQQYHLPPNTFLTGMKLLRFVTDSLLAWRTGSHFRQIEPWRAIGQLAPRPVLLLHGLDDRVVPADDAVRLYEAAGKPRALWLLPGTHHLQAYATDPLAYTARIIRFFERHLKHADLALWETSSDREHVSAHSWSEQRKSDPFFSEEAMVTSPFWQEVSSRPVPLHQPVSLSSELAHRSRMGRVDTPAPATLSSTRVVQRPTQSSNPSVWRQRAVEQRLMHLIASLFAVPQERIRPSSDLFEYGGDSATLASLLSLIEQHFQVRLETHEIFDHPDVQSLAAWIIHKHTEGIASWL